MPDLCEFTYPSPEVANEAKVAARSLEPVLAKKAARHVTVVTEHGVKVVVPREAFQLFQRLLSEMAKGNPVTIVPLHAELTTQQAAELLNVSRPYVIKLLDEGQLPFRRVGTHRRIRADELRQFKELDEAKRRRAIRELTEEAERLNLDF